MKGLKTAELKEGLSLRGLKTNGLKPVLFQRLLLAKELEAFTLPTLKDKCTYYGLPTQARKSILVEMLHSTLDKTGSSILKKRKLEPKKTLAAKRAKASSPPTKKNKSKAKKQKSKNSAAKASSPLKSLKPALSGQSTASSKSGSIDPSLLVHPHLHGCTLKMDARLALVDRSINSDKYYVLQVGYVEQSTFRALASKRQALTAASTIRERDLTPPLVRRWWSKKGSTTCGFAGEGLGKQDKCVCLLLTCAAYSYVCCIFMCVLLMLIIGGVVWYGV
jgi:hypothetical protein